MVSLAGVAKRVAGGLKAGKRTQASSAVVAKKGRGPYKRVGSEVLQAPASVAKDAITKGLTKGAAKIALKVKQRRNAITDGGTKRQRRDDGRPSTP